MSHWSLILRSFRARPKLIDDDANKFVKVLYQFSHLWILDLLNKNQTLTHAQKHDCVPLNWFGNQEHCLSDTVSSSYVLHLTMVIKHFSTFLFYFLILLQNELSNPKINWEELILSIRQSHHLRESCKNKENSQKFNVRWICICPSINDMENVCTIFISYIIIMNMIAMNSHLLMVVPQERLFLVVWQWCFHQPWLAHKHLPLYKNQGLLLSNLRKNMI